MAAVTETWLAESDNLLEWKTLGRVLSFRDGKWDEDQRGGYPSLIDHHWGGSYELNSYDDKYWMTYIGGAETGYETGPLKIGVAYTEKDPTVAHEWKAFDEPAMSPEDKDAHWFENIIRIRAVHSVMITKPLGTVVMFYNAGGINPQIRSKPRG